MRVEYIEDRKVDAALDAELRALLSSCFTGEVNAMFGYQRFFCEMPAHRWLARDGEGRLVAHLALHEKVIGTTSGDLRVGGVAEVCVTEALRGRGLVRRLVAQGNDWMIDRGTPFGTLFGNPKVYGSSGYHAVDNPIRYLDPKTGVWLVEPVASFHIKPLGSIPWPEGVIDLRGPRF